MLSGFVSLRKEASSGRDTVNTIMNEGEILDSYGYEYENSCIMSHCTVWSKFTNISDALTVCIFRAMRIRVRKKICLKTLSRPDMSQAWPNTFVARFTHPEDEGSKYL